MADTAYREMFYQALRIRLVEERIAEIYPSDKIQSPVHLSIGQEHHVAALARALTKNDIIYTTYRGHALYLARGGSMKRMFAELYGRAGGMCGGKAGSMHLCAPELGMMGSSAIVGATLPHALGAAYAQKIKGTGSIVLSVTGDGSMEEGVFHESLNFAALKKLPVVFVIENNGLAIHARQSARQAFDAAGLTAAYGISFTRTAHGADMPAVFRAAQNVMARTRNSSLPAVWEIRTYRYRQHVGISDDHHVGYRHAKEMEPFLQKDPLLTDTALYRKFAPVIEREIDAAVRYAEKSPLPPLNDVTKDVC